MTDGRRILTIPRHNPINALTMGGIAGDAGLSVDEFGASVKSGVCRRVFSNAISGRLVSSVTEARRYVRAHRMKSAVATSPIV